MFGTNKSLKLNNKLINKCEFHISSIDNLLVKLKMSICGAKRS